MAHQYARRTHDEASELARVAFRSVASEHLSLAEIEEIGKSALLTGGTVGSGWDQLLGFSPDDNDYYELQLYKPADAKPYIEKSYVRMLVPRERSSDAVHFMWRSAHA